MLKLLYEQAESKVVHLSPPEPRHTGQVQILDANRTVFPAQLPARLPLPVVAAVVNTLMTTLQVHPAHFAVTGTLLATRQSPRLTTQFLQAGRQCSRRQFNQAAFSVFLLPPL